MNEKYIHYEALDFAQDDDFIHWIRQTEQANPVFWETWQQNHPEKITVIQEAKLLVKGIVFQDNIPSDQQIEQLWQKIDAATPARQARIRPMAWLRYGAVAASLVGLFWLFFAWFSNPQVTVLADRGMQEQHRLPDGSIIILNAASSINYRPRQWSKARTINLEGEAFFEVMPGATFKVITDKGNVEVLGTSFNVEARDTRLEVACYTGEVKVTIPKTSADFNLLPGHKVFFDEVGLKIDSSTFDTSSNVSWRTGVFVFENNENVARIMSAMERQYNVNIDYPVQIAKDSLSFFFDLKHPIDSALNHFIEMKSDGLRWTRDEAKIVFEY